jgi:hypothetical protein
MAQFKRPTTTDLITNGKYSNAATNTIIETLGFTTKGDEGGALWKKTGNTITASQTPAQTGDATCSDALGNEFSLVKKRGRVNAEALGLVGDGVADDTSVLTACGLSNTDVFIADGKTVLISGVSWSSLSNFSLNIHKSSTIKLAAAADDEILRFDSCTGVRVSGGNIDGDRFNQTTSAGGFQGILFQSCDDVEASHITITGVSGNPIRSRDTTRTTVKYNKITDCGDRNIYCSPSTSGGTDSSIVKILYNEVSFETNSDPATTDGSMITCVNNSATAPFDDILIKGNRVIQHPNDVLNSQGITCGGASGNLTTNVRIKGNRIKNGEIPISFFYCDGTAVTSNNINATAKYGIEVAHGSANSTVGNNTIDGGSGANFTAIQMNGVTDPVGVTTLTGNIIKNVDIGIGSAGTIGNKNEKLVMSGNSVTNCTDKPVFLVYMSQVVSSGNEWDTVGGTGSSFRMDDCGDFSISDTFHSNAAWCIEAGSTVALAINRAVISGCSMADIDFPNTLTNWVKDNLFAGSTVAKSGGKGNVGCPDYIDWFNNIIELSGTGTPESNIIAGVGSRFIRTDGGAGTVLYIKETGTGNTGWVAK